MRAAILGFVAGVVLLQCQPNLPSWYALALLLACAILFGTAALRFHTHKAAILLRCVSGALIGILWGSLFAHHALRHSLPKAWEGRDVTLVGTVANLPSRFERGVRFHFLVERALDGEQPITDIPPKIALSWYGRFGEQGAQSVPTMQPGERWQLTVRLKRPHGNANPYGFDYEAWLLEQGIRATGYVRPDEKRARKNLKLETFVFSFASAIHSVRASLRERMESALPNAPYAGVLIALVIGEQRAIPSADWEIFTRTGISHLISISGLHITMIAGMMAALMAALWRHSFFTRAQLPLRIPAQKMAALTGALVALLYVLLAGFGVPAQRTLYMLTVVALALWQGRLTNVSHVLLLALGCVLLLDPWAVLWPGFWLSFAAVGVILYVSVGRAVQQQAVLVNGKQRSKQRIWRLLQSAGCTQYAVTLGLVPLTLLLFGQISLISPLANALAIPLVSLIVTPLALLGSVLPAPVATWVLSLAHACLSVLIACLAWMSRSVWAVWSAPIPSIPIFVIAVAGTVWLLAPRAWPVRWLGVFCWLPLIFNAPSHPQHGEAWVTVFDVGQGAAALIETRHHRLLYDTGPAYSPESDGGNRVVLPYLRGRGIHALDAMVVSHQDSDHSGGALSILNSIRVGETLSSLPEDSSIVSLSRAHRPCRSGQFWEWEGIRFEVLSPDQGSPNLKPNDISCVLKVSAGEKSILFTGDIGKTQEAHLIDRYGLKLQSTVLLAPHHGGAGSSTSTFLETVKPQWSVFQVGYQNRYHHPRSDVLARYETLGIQRLRTDETGAIRFALGKDLQVDAYRQSAARYWRHQ